MDTLQYSALNFTAHCHSESLPHNLSLRLSATAAVDFEVSSVGHRLSYCSAAMEYYPATTVETGAMPAMPAMPAPYVMPQPMDGAYITSPYMAYDYGGYTASPYQVSGLGGLDHSQGKWFAPGEALPPGFVVTAHPEGHTAPQETHAMSDLARESFVIPASSAAAATGSALKSKSKKRNWAKQEKGEHDGTEWNRMRFYEMVFGCF